MMWTRSGAIAFFLALLASLTRLFIEAQWTFAILGTSLRTLSQIDQLIIVLDGGGRLSFFAGWVFLTGFFFPFGVILSILIKSAQSKKKDLSKGSIAQEELMR